MTPAMLDEIRAMIFTRRMLAVHDIVYILDQHYQFLRIFIRQTDFFLLYVMCFRFLLRVQDMHSLHIHRPTKFITTSI